ncbi:MAG: 3-oxoacid CoA-transferase [Oscillospiraceae bacterium]|nr:3-oxoacid CoA-transferase [Oscillospiraceae bacterium]
MAKFVTVEEAVSHVGDAMTLMLGGFSTYGSPEELIIGLAERFEKTGSPRGISVISGITPGDKSESYEPLMGYNVGLNLMRADGLISSVRIALADARAIGYKIQDNKIAGFLYPMGVLLNLTRAVAGGQPGLITKVGLGTFCDPRNEGCAVNGMAKDLGPVVELMEIDGKEYLFYKAFKPDVAFIRGTYADEDGNISIEQEALIGAELEMAAAVRNNGGTVIMQVAEIVKRGSIPAKSVRFHSSFVDYIIKTQNPDNHRQCYITPKYRPELTGMLRTASSVESAMKLDPRKVIARRGAMELTPGAVINFGVGIPAAINSVADEEGIADKTVTSVESGPMGGVVQDGLAFPGVANAEAIYSQTDILNMYGGGLLDMTFLGSAEIDFRGNVNVSKFAGRNGGPGGFIDISQNAKKVFFVGMFTAGRPKPDIAITGGKMSILSDGSEIKYVNEVQQITFSGDQALKNGQEVMYISERAVFKLTNDGIMLMEIAPGVDLDKDVLGKMEFKPLVSPELKTMDARIFLEEKMGLAL